jgi:hypothetical protein
MNGSFLMGLCHPNFQVMMFLRFQVHSGHVLSHNQCNKICLSYPLQEGSRRGVTENWCTIGRIFPFLGKICHTHGKFWKYGVFNGAFHICLIFTKISSYKIFHVYLDALPMMVITLSNFGWVKSYGLLCRVLYCAALVML